MSDFEMHWRAFWHGFFHPFQDEESKLRYARKLASKSSSIREEA